MISTVFSVLFIVLRLLALGVAAFAVKPLPSRILLSGGLLVLVSSDTTGRALAWTGANQALIEQFGFAILGAANVLLSAVELFGYVLLLVGFALLSPASSAGDPEDAA